jgi:ornithine cyclodeaminase
VSVQWFDAEAVARLLPMRDAVDALDAALAGGLDPSAGPPRTAAVTSHGQLLLMPGEVDDFVGVKLVSVAPGNAALGLPRIQAVVVLMDARTLSPVALLDGTAVTSLRTPAMSAVALRHLASREPAALVVFGTGPQAWGHIHAVACVWQPTEVIVVGRDPARTDAFVRRVAEAGFSASRAGADRVADAGVVVCATTASEPLFDGSLVRDSACVLAVGSHEPQVRELDAALMGRSVVVVEDIGTALREAGDVVMAVAEGALSPQRLLPVADVVTGAVDIDRSRPRVFKSVGMAWQDLVAAAQVYRRDQGAPR